LTTILPKGGNAVTSQGKLGLGVESTPDRTGLNRKNQRGKGVINEARPRPLAIDGEGLRNAKQRWKTLLHSIAKGVMGERIKSGCF